MAWGQSPPPVAQSPMLAGSIDQGITAIIAYLLLAALLPDPEAADPTIVVTATGRRGATSTAPVAATAVSGDAIPSEGGVDLRALNELVPSLLVSSSSNEAGGAGARIRGIGTVGDNAGLESSVATFIDGIYRPRAGVALTELGAVERVDVLRGPQSTLFGRNASAGLIAVTTARPSFTPSAYAQASVGNYAAARLEGGATGALTRTLAARIDGVWFRRDGFIRDVVSGRRIDGRDRWLLRGKLLWRPDEATTVNLSFDYARRDEECCAGVYLPGRDLRSSTPGSGGGAVLAGPSSIAALIRRQGGQVLDADPAARRVALTPGQSFRQDVDDHGAALTVERRMGGVTLTAIGGWRSNNFIKGQDADFSALDLTRRPSDGSGFIRFDDFSEELRLQGTAFRGRLDWLVGGYLGEERLLLQDNLRYGDDYDRFASARTAALGGSFAAFSGFANLRSFARGFGGEALAAVVDNVPLAGAGELDRWRQHDSNQAVFTHDIIRVTPRLSLTLGARWTRDRKQLAADLASTSACSAFVNDIARLRTLAAAGGPAAAATLANSVLAPLAGYPCNTNSIAGPVHDRLTDSRWTGSAAAEYRIGGGVTGYVSWSRGYKAGGFNLDRAGLFSSASLAALPTGSLRFRPETVRAVEIGARWHRSAVDLAATLFDERFRDFQLNAYTGSNFLVSNIVGCATPLGATDSDAVAGNSVCRAGGPGVISRGVELEGSARPLPEVSLGAGLTYADTRYARDIAGSPDPVTGNNSLQPVLFLLPGHRLSNAPAWVATGSADWRPAVGQGWRALIHAGGRWQSRIDTGSDLLPEKAQGAFAVIEARLGLQTRDQRWTVSLWAENLLDRSYVQVAFAEPLQGGGSGGLPGTAPAVARFGTGSTQLFGAFLGEPRTWGLTVRRTF